MTVTITAEQRDALYDLGWGDGLANASLELESPPDVLRRVFARLRDTTATERDAQATSWAESRTLEERNRLVGEACAHVLRGLERAP
jgi:hypothetical protein